MDAKTLEIEIGRELLLPDHGLGLTLTGHSRAKRLRIHVRELGEREKRVQSRHKKPRTKGDRNDEGI